MRRTSILRPRLTLTRPARVQSFTSAVMSIVPAFSDDHMMMSL